MLDSVAGRIVPAAFGATIMISLFIYAYGGQLIVDQSNSVAENIYDLDRDSIIMITRPLRQTKIQSGFFTADLGTFVSVVNAAGSLMTMLKSFVK
jgi:hypothetical protein